MSDEPENLTLVYLRRMDAKLDRVLVDIRDLKHRATAQEVSAASIRREVAVVGEAIAQLAVRMDTFDDRLDRIERRLDLVEPTGP